ncbi:glycine betaine/L-proline ABC transporter ATP-binding protein [Marinobacterium aestuarii]|uniref:Quaternary amine transport ATP-binding protein n=1 Tax=Marinobacterium aestuarii TaxID=1821621 RepID=A0A1A9F109_9GAMM|nr:glycine betaine/L-proline ABC transporter ATP-binding protein [Marinobacterium aestuarii]ANG63855.1 glycine betaine/L-proline ABC transporter ATP-binding protein [Marinobacterium aestuarii]
MAEPLVRIENLFKVFGEKPESVIPMVEAGQSKDEILAATGHTLGLQNINLDINKGEIFVIMGLSGSGKSTLIRHFNRLIDPTQGHIFVDGVDVMKFSARELQDFRRHKMSMVFQRFGLLPHHSVLENVGYGLSIQGLSKDKVREKAMHWLDAVGLGGYEDQYPSQLSGGQQQRVGLARALCTDAEILLMDEAFSALDPLIRREMQDQLISLQHKLHKTIIFITHDLDEALRLGDKIAILRDGKLIQVGNPEDILLHPADDYVEAFVHDVNRTKVLTAAHVVNKTLLTLTGRTSPQQALDKIRERHADYACVLDGKSLKGIITLGEAERALSEGAGNIADYVSDVNCVPDSAELEALLPRLLVGKEDQPIGVTNEEGEFTGMVSRRRMAEFVS